MKPVLVDTSVWVDHFRARNAALEQLLELDKVLMHPMVLGELACGTPPSRKQTLGYLQHLRQMQQANLREVLVLIETERLFGVGCGLVDLTLLASTLMTPGAELWTLDRRLGDLAQRFAVAHRPVGH
ncbi:type II toxin-antitoxin system VapC family toxin [Variovorax paradoxus]|uniref:type II toxin-antitoxin system VapC family toxin n=1 Tax=Variovorax paradoxus TaxID=34073 RepID=UPI0029C627DC|nr:type II toxin-antitoxin system VapC family toxin [Variovorax paradoxus]WPH23861.1 type II toxin-antitoxin system VapC family toxin [Variovorax paradoxus]